MTQNWQINWGIFSTIYFRILGLGYGLDTSGLVNIPGENTHRANSEQTGIQLSNFIETLTADAGLNMKYNN